MFDGTVTLCVGSDGKRMEIHRNLLASISPELNKHVNNDMKEGIEGIIRLPEEEEETLILFSEWAYTGTYTIVDNTALVDALNPDTGRYSRVKADPWPSLLMHLRLYVFSDKFNIPTLKRLAKSCFSEGISPIQLTLTSDAAGLASVIEYAYDNLPDSDPLPKFLAQFASWGLRYLTESDEFIQLTSTHPDFMRGLFGNLQGPRYKPALS